MAKDLEYYLAQARRISEHREKGAEKAIRKLYKEMLANLQQFMGEAYVQYAQDDRLTYAMIQAAGYDARFLEEIEQQMNIGTVKAQAAVRQLVEDTYEAAYKSMVDGVNEAAKTKDGLEAIFGDRWSITPEQIKRAVENPVYGLTLKDTLEKNRKEIIYDIKRTVGVGLMNGDRYTTMAKRIAESVDGDYRKAIRIARTEAHRTREGGNMDAAHAVDEEMQDTSTGLRMVKTWKTMKDERVRPQRRRRGKKGGWTSKMGKGANHMVLDGQTVLADEPFDLGGGVTAMNPGNSGVAGHDINCRCYVSYDMLTDAEYFKKSGKHFPNWQEPDPVAAKYGFNTIAGEHTREADLAATNPNYSTHQREWTENCQRCVSAYEARRRGYDVEAMPRLLNGLDLLPYMADTQNGWTSVYANVNPILCSSNRTVGVLKKVEDTVRSFGDGARAIIRVQWQKKYGGGGHVFIAEQENGKTIFIDPQNNNRNVISYFPLVKTKETYVVRIDNLEFTDQILKCCKNKK